MKSQNKLAGLGMLTALSASLCCIVPVLAILAGTSGLASALSWLEPLRPYLIGATVLVLGLAWYQKLKPLKQADCSCETTEKTPFIRTKKFLGLVTVFAALMLAFPLYAQIFYPRAADTAILSDPTSTQKAEFTIRGMTCAGCEKHINQEIGKLPGIFQATVSYENGNAIVAFDGNETDMEEIEKAISKTGYTVTGKKEVK